MSELSKTDKVKAFVKAGDYDSALKIAKTFKIWDNKADKEQVQLASEIKANASFYKQVGKDIEAEYQKGIDVLNKIYGEEVWKQVIFTI